MDEQLSQIWEDASRATENIFNVGHEFQGLCESSIANLAALKLLNDDSVEEAVKN